MWQSITSKTVLETALDTFGGRSEVAKIETEDFQKEDPKSIAEIWRVIL